jgi:hypothetical protein
MKTSIRVLLVGIATAATVAQAHHSFAMFDFEKTTEVEGVVREMRFAAPHVWIYVIVKDPAKGEVDFGIEGAAPNTLLRAGWKRDSIKSGDQVKVKVHPLRDGTPGGSLVDITVNGKAVVGAR